MTVKVGCLVVLAGLAASCERSPGPPCAQVNGQFSLAPVPLAQTADATLIRAGDGFVLAGLDGTTVRWGKLGIDGTISGESQFALPEAPALMPDGRALGPVFAVTQKVAPGDQLVMALMVEKAPNTYEVHAYVHDLGSVEAPTPHVLGDLVASSKSGTIRVVAGSPTSGKTALVLWGIEGQPAPIRYQALGADGVALAQPGKFLDNPEASKIPAWKCVAVTQSRDSFAVTLVEEPSGGSPLPLWHRYDLADDGTTQGEALIYMHRGEVADCRITSSPTPTPGGYLVVWQTDTNTGGTYFARMNPPLPDAGTEDMDIATHAIMASELYGGYSRMPKLLWTAPAGSGYEFTVGLLDGNVPMVKRFNLQADPKGSTLHLPTTGPVGPVSSWDGPDATWVTYLNLPATKAGATTPAVRLLLKVAATEIQ